MKNKGKYDLVRKPAFLDNLPTTSRSGFYQDLLDDLEGLRATECVKVGVEVIPNKHPKSFIAYVKFKSRGQKRDYRVGGYYDSTHEIVYLWKR